MRSSKPSQIRDLLENSEASRLFSRARDLGQLDALVHQLIPPPLNRHCRVLAVRDDTLIVAADSAAWATRLRYQSPQLVKQLAGVSRVTLRRIQVRVRAAEAHPAKQPAPPRRPVPVKRSMALKQAARNVTDTGLKAALLRLAAHLTSAGG